MHFPGKKHNFVLHSTEIWNVFIQENALNFIVCEAVWQVAPVRDEIKATFLSSLFFPHSPVLLGIVYMMQEIHLYFCRCHHS